MLLKGYDFRTRFNLKIEKISMKSRELADNLVSVGVDDSYADELLDYLSGDGYSGRFAEMYKDLVKKGLRPEFFRALNRIDNAEDYTDVYAAAALIAQNNDITVEDFIQVVKNNEPFEVEDALKSFGESQAGSKDYSDNVSESAEDDTENSELENSQTDNKVSDDENSSASDTEVITNVQKSELQENNMFAQAVEDLLGVSAFNQENEDVNSELETLVKLVMNAISEDKRKTDLINNLYRVINLANKQIMRATDRLGHCNAVENELRGQIYHLTQERNDYKKKYEELNDKIGELSSLAAFTRGVKRIE